MVEQGLNAVGTSSLLRGHLQGTSAQSSVELSNGNGCSPLGILWSLLITTLVLVGAKGKVTLVGTANKSFNMLPELLGKYGIKKRVGTGIDGEDEDN